MNKLKAILKLSKEKGFESLNEECHANKDRMCHSCSFYQIMKHNMCVLGCCANQLLDEYIPPRKLTKRERAFCEYAQSGWIVRNKDMNLYWFKEKPYKVSGTENYWEGQGAVIELINYTFHFVTWYQEPYSVEELLKWDYEKE